MRQTARAGLGGRHRLVRPLLVCASGRFGARALFEYAIEGAPSGPAEPSPLARATREHPDVAWLLDPDAAAVISR
jgi:hypothetical protein